MSYTRPAYDAAHASWQGAVAYTRPAYNAADASWQPGTPVGQIVASSPLGAPSVIGASGTDPEGLAAAPSPLAAASVVGAAVVAGRASVASPLAAPGLSGRIVVRGFASTPSPLAPGAVVGTVVRYELRGEVRDQGVLVNRRVRAYLRSTGELVAEVDTVGGLFALPAGFSAAEYYLIPINLAADATDFAPPCTNRVTSVLATDVAA